MPSMQELVVVTAKAIERQAKEPNRVGLSTGLPALDRMTEGWQRGYYTALAGNSGVGKSLFLTWQLVLGAEQLEAGTRPGLGVFADAAQGDDSLKDREGKPPLMVFFSLEMNAMMVTSRMVAQTMARQQVEVDSHDIMFGKWPAWDSKAKAWASAHDRQAYKDGLRRLAQLGKYIYVDFEARTVARMRAVLTELARSYDIVWVGIDYFRLIEDASPGGDGVGRQEAISSALKRLSTDYMCGLFVVIDVTREGERSEQVEAYHIKWGNAVRYDADIVITLSAAEDTGSVQRQVHCKIAKNRVGTEGAFTYVAYLKSGRIVEAQETQSSAPFDWDAQAAGDGLLETIYAN